MSYMYVAYVNADVYVPNIFVILSHCVIYVYASYTDNVPK